MYYRLICDVKVKEEGPHNIVNKLEMIVVDQDAALAWFHEAITGGSYDHVYLTTIVDYEDGHGPYESTWKYYNRFAHERAVAEGSDQF